MQKQGKRVGDKGGRGQICSQGATERVPLQPPFRLLTVSLMCSYELPLTAVQPMMYGFGDDVAPLPETVNLVEASLASLLGGAHLWANRPAPGACCRLLMVLALQLDARSS